MQNTIVEAEKSISQQVETISRLASVASKYPYYKYNGTWTRDVQNTVSSTASRGWYGNWVLTSAVLCRTSMWMVRWFTEQRWSGTDWKTSDYRRSWTGLAR